MPTEIEALHDAIWKRLFDEKTGMIYTCVNPRTLQPVFPTVEEVWRSIPNTAGWQTPAEDCCLCAGIYLPALLLRYADQPTPEHEHDVRALFQGLRTLATCGRRRGFIARGVLPDGKTHYMDSSVDQYTHFLFGVWRYFESSLATEDDRAFIRKIVSDICLQFEEDDFYIQNEAGTAATFGDINAMSYTRVERVLQPFAIGWKITGNEHFAEVYRKLKAEQDGKRMQILRDTSPSMGDCLYAYYQTQMALRCLYEIEPDPQDRAVFGAAMNRIGASVASRAGNYIHFKDLLLADKWEFDWRKNWNERKTDNIWVFHRQLSESGKLRFVEHIARTVREPAEAITCLLLSADPAYHAAACHHAEELLRTIDVEHIWVSDAWVAVGYACRLAQTVNNRNPHSLKRVGSL